MCVYAAAVSSTSVSYLVGAEAVVLVLGVVGTGAVIAVPVPKYFLPV